MKIYADILFLNNFFMDLVLIYITSDIAAAGIKPVRAIISAAAGAFLGVLFFVLDFGKEAALFLSAVIGLAMAAIAFCPCKKNELIRRTLVLYPAFALICGAIFLDMRMFGGGMIKNGVFYASSPRICIVAAFSYFLLRMCAARLKRQASKKFLEIFLEYNGKKICTKAFYDTGNGLFEPISGKPVMIIEEKLLKELVGEKCCEKNICEWVESERIKIIPYKTVGTEGYLTGIVLDRAYIDGKCTEKAIAAVCGQKLKYPVILNVGM